MNKEWKDYELEEIPTAPTLSFDIPDEEPAPVAEAEKRPKPMEVPDIQLSPEELAIVDDFVDKIDLTNSQAVMNYGNGTQKKMADFSEK